MILIRQNSKWPDEVLDGVSTKVIKVGFWLYNPVFECIWKTLLQCYIIYKSMGSWTTTVNLVLRRCSTFCIFFSCMSKASSGNTLGKILQYEQFGSNIIGVKLKMGQTNIKFRRTDFAQSFLSLYLLSRLPFQVNNV